MLSKNMLERLSMHRLASVSATVNPLCQHHAPETSRNLCVDRCWHVRKGSLSGLKAATSAAAPTLCRAWVMGRSRGARRACTGNDSQYPGQAASCDSLCKAVGHGSPPAAPQPASCAPAVAGCGHSLLALLGTAESGVAAALAALLLLSAPAAAAESGVAYDPGAGGDLLKNLAGAAYLLLVAVFLARLLRRRTNSSLSQVRMVAAACTNYFGYALGLCCPCSLAWCTQVIGTRCIYLLCRSKWSTPYGLGACTFCMQCLGCAFAAALVVSWHLRSNAVCRLVFSGESLCSACAPGRRGGRPWGRRAALTAAHGRSSLRRPHPWQPCGAPTR